MQKISDAIPETRLCQFSKKPFLYRLSRSDRTVFRKNSFDSLLLMLSSISTVDVMMD
jgi:hypothetical protein